jgi:hypothetical protein
MAHQPRPIGPARVQHKMEVIAHLAVGQHLGIEAFHRPRDDFDLRDPVLIIPIDRLAPVAGRRDMVDGAGEFDAKGKSVGRI